MASQVAVLFDLDGTLTDSKAGILGSLRKTLTELRIAYDGPLEYFIGPPVEEWAVELLPDAGESARRRLAATYRAHYDREGWTQNSVYPGIMELLSGLREQGAALYVCTSKQERFARRIVTRFGMDQYFQGIYGDQPDLDHSKTALLARLLQQEKLPANCASMVGDRCFDIAAAHANGLRAVGVTWGYGSVEELTQAGAEVLCSTPNDVLSAVLAGQQA
jgi:phosphoglycolate phosphatase